MSEAVDAAGNDSGAVSCALAAGKMPIWLNSSPLAVTAALLMDVQDRAAASKPIIAAPIDHTTDAKEAQSARAHDTRLTCHIQLCSVTHFDVSTTIQMSCIDCVPFAGV